MLESTKRDRKRRALMILARLDMSPNTDFHALTGGEVQALLREADNVNYRAPANANGSRARYFLEKLQRESKW